MTERDAALVAVGKMAVATLATFPSLRGGPGMAALVLEADGFLRSFPEDASDLSGSEPPSTRDSQDEELDNVRRRTL